MTIAAGHQRAGWRSPPARSHVWWLAASAVVVAIVLAPLGGLVYFALRGSGDVWPNLIANVLPEAMRTTALLLLGVGTLVAVIGVGTAWLVTVYDFPGRRVFEWALLLPLAVPTYIVAYAYLDVLHPIGPVQTTLREILGIARPRDLWFPEIRSLHGCIFLLGMVLYPYVYLPVRALFMMQSATTIEVARTLGAGPLGVFLRVALPLARPAIAVGVSLALMEALNDIGASEFLGIRTLTVAIYTTWTTRLSVEGAAQIALIMLCIVFSLILLERWARRRQRFATKARIDHTPKPRAVSRNPSCSRLPRLPAADRMRLRGSHQLPRRRVVEAHPLLRPARRAARMDRQLAALRRDRDGRRCDRRPGPRLHGAALAQPRRAA